MRKKCALLLVFTVLLLCLPQPRTQAVLAESSIKVGLYYGSNALSSANLQNVTGYGSGYQAGWLDEAGRFNALGFLPNVYLTVYPDTTSHMETGQTF